MSTQQAKNSVLTQTEAQVRFQQVQNVNYLMTFQLPESDPTYQGQIEILFDLTPNASKLSSSLKIDFSNEGNITELLLNGKPVPFEHQNSKVSISMDQFTTGNHSLKIQFSHPYQHTGFGFHRGRDSADGEYYMYSDFEPYNANKAFPVFDQPDLKASYKLTVTAPKKWQIISNTQETSISEMPGELRTWTFPTSARFSSYLFALIGGPFEKWESKTASGVPLRLFARRSLSKYVSRDAEHWFLVTQEGFKFFESAFGYPYPFGKYDQILTPDYNHGAMENIGAVTFTEAYAFRTDVTPTRILDRAETIIHELAHMWFGNLVTMKWWDDLWLNESFATYVSNLAMSKFQEKIGPAQVWQQFNSHNKEWAYREDDLVTTHPIVGTAADTDEALANFDGITYGKGASVLKQLVHFIGEEAFLSGLRGYFKQFAFQNADRADFLQALSIASQKNLTDWENSWLKSSGTNSVQVVLSERDGKINQLILKQFPDEADKRLRPHKTELGLYDLNSNGEIVLRETISVTYSEESTLIKEAEGKPAPKFIFPNVADHDFVQIILDDQSLASLQISLGKIADPLLRQMLWFTLWGMVQHAKLPAQTFAQMALAHLEKETDLAVLQNGLSYLSGASFYLAPALKMNHELAVEAFTLKLLEKADSQNPVKISLFSRYVGSARSDRALQQIKGWLSQTEIFPGFLMDQERRWTVIGRLSAKGLSEAKELVSSELKRDQNDKGVLSAISAQAAFPEEENKKLWWNRILKKDPKSEPLSTEKARVVMSVFHDVDCPEVTQFMLDSFFEILPGLAASQFSAEFNASFARFLFPLNYSEEFNRKVDSFLTKQSDLQVGVRRALQKNRQQSERTLKARALSASQIR